MIRGSTSDLFKNGLWFPFSFLLPLIFGVTCSNAAELTLTSSLGYDSNPGLYEDEEGSAYAFYGLLASHRLISTAAAELKISASASYRNHFSLGDNYRLEAGPELSFPLLKGVLIPSVELGGAIYRDHLVDEDERNEVFAGIGLAWFMSQTVLLTFHSEIRRLDYLNESSLYGGRSDAGSTIGRGGVGRASFRNGKGPGGGQGQGPPGGWTGYTEGHQAVHPGREDTVTAIGSDLDLALSPTLSIDIYGYCGRLESSRYEETRDTAELGLSLKKRWAELWVFELYTSFRSAWFDESRRDSRGFLSARISRLFGRFRVFAGAAFIGNDSTAEGESYSQVITECGLSWSY